MEINKKKQHTIAFLHFNNSHLDHAPAAMASVPHPLCPLTGDEIQSTARLIESVWPESVSLSFKVITLSEPPKEKLAPYLQALDNSQSPSPLERRVFVAYYVRNTVRPSRCFFIETANIDAMTGHIPRSHRQLDHRKNREQCEAWSECSQQRCLR